MTSNEELEILTGLDMSNIDLNDQDKAIIEVLTQAGQPMTPGDIQEKILTFSRPTMYARLKVLTNPPGVLLKKGKGARVFYGFPAWKDKFESLTKDSTPLERHLIKNAKLLVDQIFEHDGLNFSNAQLALIKKSRMLYEVVLTMKDHDPKYVNIPLFVEGKYDNMRSGWGVDADPRDLPRWYRYWIDVLICFDAIE
jgi:hypothetical protein